MNGRTADVATVVALTVAGALPGLVLSDVIDGRASVLGAAVAALAAAATAVVVARRSAVLVAAAFVVGALATATVTAAAWPGDAGRSLPAATADALARGWSTLVTAPIPSAPSPRLLVPITLTVWAAVFGAVVAARRGSARLVALVPPLLALVLASVAAGSAQAATLASGAVFVAAGVVVAVARGPRPPAARGRRVSWRPLLVTAAGGTAVAVLVAALAGPSLADARDGAPFDPRDHLDPPTLPAETDNPLDLVSSWLQHPDEVLFTVRSSEPLTTRLVALDTFDGATWTTSGSWVVPGSRITPPARPRAARRPVDATVSVDAGGLPGPFLPSIGDTTRVAGVAVIVEPRSGALAMADGAAAGHTYSVSGELASVAGLTEREFNALPAATGPEADAARQLPADTPAILVESAEAVTAGRTTPMDQAVSINNFFVNGAFRLTDAPRSGHAFFHILQTLGVTLEGTSEQYAAAFAVYGRIVGLPTRLVVGFRPGVETSPGVRTVRAGDVTVWPEVLFGGVGWLPFNPTPAGQTPEQTDGALKPSDVGDREVPPAPPPTTIAPPAKPDAPRDPSGTGTGRSTGAGSTLATVALVGVGVVLVAAVLAAVVTVVLKRRRTAQRRRDGDARHRVLGAWHDLLDRLRETDGTVRADLTVEEVVRDNGHADAPLDELYLPVVRAAYGHVPVEPADATLAWAVRDRFVQARRDQLGVARRCRAALDPRPVLHPSGGSTSKGAPS